MIIKNIKRVLKILSSLFFLCLSMVLPVLVYAIFDAEFLAFLEVRNSIGLYLNIWFVTGIITCSQLDLHDYATKYLYDYIFIQKIRSPWIAVLVLIFVMIAKMILLTFSYKISAMIAIFYQLSSPQAISNITGFLILPSIILIMANVYKETKHSEIYTTSIEAQSKEEKQDVH